MVEARTMHQQLDDLVKERTSELEKRNAELVEQADRVRICLHNCSICAMKSRRNIARELHDGVGQLAVVMKMNLAKIHPSSPGLTQSTHNELTENGAILDQFDHRQIQQSIMCVSVRHPGCAGISGRLQWFVEGFSKRSKIDVALDLPSEDRRLPPGMELHLFRMAQECLTNSIATVEAVVLSCGSCCAMTAIA